MIKNRFVTALVVLFFATACSTGTDSNVVSLSAESTTTSTIPEEDYPIVLTQCLNEEKDYDIVTPFDVQDLKTTLDQMSNTKDERTQLLEDVDFCVNKYDLFSESNTTNPDELAKLYDENLEIARCLREKGINVPDPSQQQPKLDLSGLKSSKDDITPLLQECGWQK
ncbi:hypothetical protein N9P11_00655 [Acidimicrobiia bacterium]|nr:hypothetical protein [Acidimicrobiia bacterium]